MIIYGDTQHLSMRAEVYLKWVLLRRFIDQRNFN